MKLRMKTDRSSSKIRPWWEIALYITADYLEPKWGFLGWVGKLCMVPVQVACPPGGSQLALAKNTLCWAMSLYLR